MFTRILLGILLTISSAFSFGDTLAKENRQQIIRMQHIIAEQNERIDGLTSLIEGMSASIAALRATQKHRAVSSEDDRNRKLIMDLGKMIDDINQKYVSKDELARIIAQRGTVEAKGTHRAHPKKKAGETNMQVRSPATLYSEGVRKFVKKRYDEAGKRFAMTAKKGYKPAASNYYLGEIAYYTKQYKDAIFYYKKSAGLYDQASYMDVLMLHTAISLEKTGQKEQAKRFYENVIENYPGKKAASIAKSRLQRIS